MATISENIARIKAAAETLAKLELANINGKVTAVKTNVADLVEAAKADAAKVEASAEQHASGLKAALLAKLAEAEAYAKTLEAEAKTEFTAAIAKVESLFATEESALVEELATKLEAFLEKVKSNNTTPPAA